MLPRRLSLLAFALTLAACGNDPPKAEPAKEAAPPASAAAPAAAQPAAATPSATPSAAPAAAAAAPAAAAKPPSSPEPDIKEWDASKQDLKLVKNWAGPGCMPRRVREWIRIGCAGAATQKGAPISIQIVKGFPKSKLSVLEERGGSMMLVFPATEGLDAEATFTFSEGTFRFTASWPAGQPEPTAIGAFQEVERPVEIPSAADGEPGDSPSEAAPGDSPAAPAPAKLEKAVVSADPLPELPEIEGAPTAEQWATAKEVGVKGSDALGCETKQIGDWFRVVCRSNNNTGKVSAATSIRGFDPKQGYLVTGNGAMVLLTKYVKGTDLAIDITWEKTVGRLNLKWPDTLANPPVVRGELISRA